MNKEEKCRITQKNRIVIHKQDKEKRVYREELNNYLEKGWQLGISEKHRKTNSEKHKGKPTWDKGTKGVMKPNKTSFKKGNIPWIKGKKGVVTAWNKGLTKETDSRIVSHTVSEENKIKSRNRMLGNTINVGREYSKEHCQHISESKKGHPVTEKTKKKISSSLTGKRLSEDKLLIKTTKQYLTRKKNNSFNKSQPEEDFYNQLIEENKNKTIYRQYKDLDRYPFYSDFYIKEDDLFIECNFHWTHGGKPYDPNDKECIEKLKIWREKAKTSKFYQQAIYIWTELDPKKAKTAKDNNLNFKAIY